MKQVALITGVTRQDGSYLAELLLKPEYKVRGINGRASNQMSRANLYCTVQDPRTA